MGTALLADRRGGAGHDRRRVSWRVRRDDPDVAVWLRWAALVLLVANLVNKQAFYNQYWLVGPGSVL